MANPRKFSEKIALHNQKQAEETAAFEQIMREARAVTTAPQQVGGQRDQSATARQPQPQLLNAITNASFRGGSLPNVNAMAQRGDRTQPARPIGQLSTSPRASQSKIGHPRYSQKARADNAPYASPPSLSHLNQAVSGGNSPILCPVGPYGSNNYLAIPGAENAWRRANSDSAINSINSLMIPSVVPDSSEESSNNSNDPRDGYVLTTASSSTQIHPLHQLHQLNKPHDGSGVIPTTVGDGPNLLEIPTSVSTGSLPDLTNFQFQPPIQQPVESPLSMTYSHSPTSCSPHSQQQQQQQPSVTGNLPQHQGQQVVPQQPQVQHQQPPRSPIPSHHPQHQQSQPQQAPQQPQQTQPPHSSPSQHHPNSPGQLLDNPISVNTSFQQQSFADGNLLTAYRCPPRPSPQNSPSPFRSPSPHDGQLSAPPSPSNQPLSADSLFLSQQANALQQHFEQISMVDGTPQTNSNNNRQQWQQGGANLYFYNTAQQQQQIGQTAGVPTTTQTQTQQQSPSHPQPATPQTPSSIPEIIFSEFLGSECSDPYPLEDFLTSEAAAAAIREGLGTIDTGDFQILADSNILGETDLVDPEAEERFRLDRL